MLKISGRSKLIKCVIYPKNPNFAQKCSKTVVFSLRLCQYATERRPVGFKKSISSACVYVEISGRSKLIKCVIYPKNPNFAQKCSKTVVFSLRLCQYATERRPVGFKKSISSACVYVENFRPIEVD